MSNHGLLLRMMLGVAGLAGAGSQALGADFTTIIVSTDVARPAAEVWKEVGDFCDVGVWLKMKCAYISGSGGLGTVRQLAGRIDEVMVAQTQHSYTITQPTNKDLFHATLAVEPAGTHASKIIYSIVYDQSNLLPGETKGNYRTQHIKMYTSALALMKKRIEGH